MEEMKRTVASMQDLSAEQMQELRTSSQTQMALFAELHKK